MFAMLSLKKTEIRKIVIFPAAVLLLSCGLFSSDPPPPRNETKSILFKCDKYINSGMLLPAELIYVTADDDLKQITAIGPDAWFDSKEREKWPFKETFMLRSGQDYLLRLTKPPDCKSLVIFTSFFQVKEAEAQQVILTTDAKEKEVIWIGAESLYH
ncbi:MAG: hypothetical protein V2I97_22905 [Desulfococcaceae bacterium]|jgi:hypothetical protein|nr:hypothetical protein [Desulfococcaceae bacterium]